MEKNDIIYFIICFIIGIIIGVIAAIYNYNKNNKINYIITSDTVYNKIILDSIEYNIIKKDSVIYNIKQEMKDEITKSFELSDSAAVKLFKKLCTAN